MIKDKKGEMGWISWNIIAVILISTFLISLLFDSLAKWILIISVSIGIIIYIIINMDNTFFKSALSITLIGGGLIFVFATGIMQEAYTGVSILSIDQIDNVGVGEEFLVYASAGSGSDRIRIDEDDFKNEVNQELEGEGYMIDRGIPIDISLTETEYSFPYKTTSKNFYSLKEQDLEQYIGTEVSCDMEDCLSSEVPFMGNYILAYAYDTSWYGGKKCKCIYYESIAQAGEFSSGVQELDFNLEFNVDGQTSTMTTDNPTLSMNNFRAEYVGNLEGDIQLSPPDYQLVIVNGEPQYLVMENAVGFKGIDNPENYISSCIGNIDTSQDVSNSEKVQDCFNKYINDVNSATEWRTNEYESETGGSITYEGSNLIVKNPDASIKPQFKMFIDADWVGLEELIGEPQITSCAEDIEIDSSETERVGIRIKNIGNQKGTFNYKAECDEGISYTSAESISLNAGDEDTLEVTFGGRAIESDISGSCKHIFTDSKSGDSSSCTSDVNVRFTEDVCNPGTTRCDGDELQKCNAEGTAWVYVKTCIECEQLSGTSAKCEEDDIEEINPELTCNNDNDCKDNYICVDNSCVYDESLVCSWYEDKYTKTEKDYGTGYWKAIVPFVEPTETEVEECKIKPEIVFGAIILVILFSLYLSYLYYSKVKGGKKKKKR